MAITKYSVDDYEEMVRLGVLTESDRVELIRGEIFCPWPRGMTPVSWWVPAVSGLEIVFNRFSKGRMALW